MQALHVAQQTIVLPPTSYHVLGKLDEDAFSKLPCDMHILLLDSDDDDKIRMALLPKDLVYLMRELVHPDAYCYIYINPRAHAALLGDIEDQEDYSEGELTPTRRVQNSVSVQHFQCQCGLTQASIKATDVGKYIVGTLLVDPYLLRGFATIWPIIEKKKKKKIEACPRESPGVA